MPRRITSAIPVGTQFSPDLVDLRQRVFAEFAYALRAEKVLMPTEDPPCMLWLDRAGAKNTFFVSVLKKNYEGRRGWSLCINTGAKLQTERVSQFTSQLQASLGTSPADSEDSPAEPAWSYWQRVVTVEQEEVLPWSHWLGQVAHARLVGSVCALAPEPGSVPNYLELMEKNDLTQYYSRRGSFALFRENPVPGR